MRRLLTASALLALAAFAMTAATGQPPGGADKKQPGAKADKKIDPTDAAIAAALANDPDVKMAKAKIQLAEAELTKARHTVTLKVVTVRAAVEEHKVLVAQCEERAAWTERMVKAGNVSQAQMITEREKLATAKAALARAETELKLLTGGAIVAAADDPHHDVIAAISQIEAAQADKTARLEYIRMLQLAHERTTAVKGPIPDRIRAALDKPVKLGAKGEQVTFAKALEVFKKEAGLDVPVRGLVLANGIASQGEEIPVGAWFQLFQDENGGAFYVREYGLLFAKSDPPDAPTLTNFWKQKPAAKDTKPDPAPKK